MEWVSDKKRGRGRERGSESESERQREKRERGEERDFFALTVSREWGKNWKKGGDG
jgi:hypothetical protein